MQIDWESEVNRTEDSCSDVLRDALTQCERDGDWTSVIVLHERKAAPDADTAQYSWHMGGPSMTLGLAMWMVEAYKHGLIHKHNPYEED